MGVWNQTDLVTQLPIRGNEPVRMILLRQQQYAGFTRSYANEAWQPVGLPISGIYDVYGSIDGVDMSRPEVRLTIQIMEETLGRSFASVDFSDTSEKKNLGHFLWEYELFIPSVNNPQRLVWFQNSPDGVDEEGQSVGERRKEAVSYGFALVKEEVYQGMIRLLGNAHQKNLERVHNHARGEHDRSIAGFLNSRLDGGSLLSNHLKEIIEPLAEFMTFFRAVDHGRKQFVPQNGQGSQDKDWEYHRNIAQMIIDITSREIAEEAAEEDE